MNSLKWLYVAFKTKPGMRDGTDASLFLIANTNGRDVFYRELGQLCPETKNFADKSYANFFAVDVSTSGQLEVEVSTYFRMAIGTRAGWTCYYADSWSPQTVFVWGELYDSSLVPLAFQRNADSDLAKTNLSPVSIPIPRATPCQTRTQPLADVLVIVLTSDGAWDPVSISLQANAHVPLTLLDIPLSDHEQWDTMTGVTNLYLPSIDKRRQFTPQALAKGRVVFRKEEGADSWEPSFVHMFGIREHAAGYSEVFEILSVKHWNHGALTNDRPEIAIDLT